MSHQCVRLNTTDLKIEIFTPLLKSKCRTFISYTTLPVEKKRIRQDKIKIRWFQHFAVPLDYFYHFHKFSTMLCCLGIEIFQAFDTLTNSFFRGKGKVLKNYIQAHIKDKGCWWNPTLWSRGEHMSIFAQDTTSWSRPTNKIKKNFVFTAMERGFKFREFSLVV